MLRLSFRDFRVFQQKPLVFMREVLKDAGDVAVCCFLGKRVWVIHEPLLSHQILKSSDFIRASWVFSPLKPVTGQRGLVQLNDEDWGEQYPYFKANFSKQGISGWLGNLSDNIKAMLPKLEKGSANVHSLMMELTLRNVLFVLGISQVASADQIIQIMLALNSLCGDHMRQLIRIPTYIPLPQLRAIQRYRKALATQLEQLLTHSHFRPNSTLAKMSQTLSFQTQRDHLSTFLFAGFETTATLLTMALSILGKDHDLQNQIACEFSNLNSLSSETLITCIGTKGLIEETLRLYPPAYMLVREPKQGLNIGDYQFNRGDLLIINTHGIHRHPDYWPKPKQFDITRHLDSNPFSNKAYFPFGLGKRLCSGYHLALFEAMLTVGLIIREYQLSNKLAIKPLMNTDITLHPRTQTCLNFQKRTKII